MVEDLKSPFIDADFPVPFTISSSSSLSSAFTSFAFPFPFEFVGCGTGGANSSSDESTSSIVSISEEGATAFVELLAMAGRAFLIGLVARWIAMSAFSSIGPAPQMGQMTCVVSQMNE